MINDDTFLVRQGSYSSGLFLELLFTRPANTENHKQCHGWTVNEYSD